VAVDVSSTDTTSVFQKIEQVLNKHEKITMLINNVGVNNSQNVPTLFKDSNESDVDNIINVNVKFSTRMTKLTIPHLIKNQRSAIINVSSITWAMPGSPYLSVYAGTKAYNAVFSKALTPELKRQGCDVLAVSPAYIMSNMTSLRRPTLFVRSPNEIARACLPHLGNKTELTAFWSHSLMRLAAELGPSSLMVNQTYNLMEKANKYMLNKLNKAN